jgi:uncharacterized membrane protein
VVSLGSVDLLVFGFDFEVPLPRGVRDQLDCLRGRGIIRILDVLYISNDDQGIFRVGQPSEDLGAPSTSAQSVLWRLLAEDDSEQLPAGSLDAHRAGDVGLDLTAVEGLAHSIEPGTSALLMLVETLWERDVLDAVLTADGFPIVFGRLEPETMLVIGADLGSAARVARVAERVSADRGAATLDALDIAETKATLAALLNARLIVACDVEDALDALAAAGVVPLASLVRARGQADAAAARDLQGPSFRSSGDM